MLKVQVSSRRSLYAKLTSDTHPNKGGFYCQVYRTPDEDFDEVGSFTVDRNISHGDMNKAYMYAKNYIQRNY